MSWNEDPIKHNALVMQIKNVHAIDDPGIRHRHTLSLIAVESSLQEAGVMSSSYMGALAMAALYPENFKQVAIKETEFSSSKIRILI